MKKIKIGEDKAGALRYQRESEAKIQQLEQLCEKLNEFVTIDIAELLKADAIQYFIKLFQDKYENEFPSIVPLDKRLQLSGINIDKLDEEFNRINEMEGDIEFNNGLLTAKAIDFNHYIEDKGEIKRYEAVNRFIEALKEFRSETGCYYSALQLCRVFPQHLTFDSSKNWLIPSPNFYKIRKK